ncbi:MAG: hypothetical protein ACTSWN_15615 [Promethearchaeota archaeon]
MKIEPIDEIMKKVKSKFDKDSSDWRILSDIDPFGNKDLFISQRENLWQIKTKPLNPTSGIAKGCFVRNLDDEIQAELEKKGLAGNKYIFSMLVPIHSEKNAIIASGIESFSRNHSKKLKEMLDEKNKNLQRDLTRSVEKTFEREHLQRKNLYL